MELGTWANAAELTVAGFWAKDKAKSWQAGWTEQTRVAVTLWGWAVGTVLCASFLTLAVAQIILFFLGVYLLDVFADGVSFFEAALNGEVHHDHDLHGQLPCVPE